MYGPLAAYFRALRIETELFSWFATEMHANKRGFVSIWTVYDSQNSCASLFSASRC